MTRPLTAGATSESRHGRGFRARSGKRRTFAAKAYASIVPQRQVSECSIPCDGYPLRCAAEAVCLAIRREVMCNSILPGCPTVECNIPNTR